MPPSQRSPGRPLSGTGPLDRDRIVHEASALVEKEGPQFSWRSLARSLEVDAMALYRYFPTRDDLWGALAEARLAPLWSWKPENGAGWKDGLAHLTEAYLALVAEVPELVRHLARNSIAARTVAERLKILFDGLTSVLDWTADQSRSAYGAWVDLAHGMALAGPLPNNDWHRSLDWLLNGFGSTRA